MYFPTALILGLVAGSAVGTPLMEVEPRAERYRCQTTVSPTSGRGGTTRSNVFYFDVSAAYAAKTAGGSTTGGSGFPHSFGGKDGSGAQMKFQNGANGCDGSQPMLEFPIMRDGSIYPKDSNRGGDGTPTPARVIYLNNANLDLCGVVTHALEDAQGRGRDSFHLCEYGN